MARAVDKKYYPSEELEEFLGSGKKITRGQLIKEIWAYATDNDLKTTKKYKNRNMGAIKSDSELAPIIGRGTISAPEIMKNIGVHLLDD